MYLNLDGQDVSQPTRCISIWMYKMYLNLDVQDVFHCVQDVSQSQCAFFLCVTGSRAMDAARLRRKQTTWDEDGSMKVEIRISKIRLRH